MNRQAYISHEKGKWCVRSENNPDWSGGCYPTRSEAEERLRQVEKFKHMKGNQREGSMKTKISERIENINRYLAADEEPETEEKEKEED